MEKEILDILEKLTAACDKLVDEVGSRIRSLGGYFEGFYDFIEIRDDVKRLKTALASKHEAFPHNVCKSTKEKR